MSCRVNKEIYSNDIEKYKITLHSIDFTEYGEKILVITDHFDENIRCANLTYKNKNGIYSPLDIVSSTDSAFIYQISENPNFHKILIFKGYKSKNITLK